VKDTVFILKVLFMEEKLQNSNQISICHKDSCIHAIGKNTDLIAVGAFTMLVLVGVSALIKSN
jgi:hypothetical protein